MHMFENNTIVTIINLEESGMYPKELLDNIKHNEYEVLERLPKHLKTDKDYMEPLLYAVKNDFNTYVVYKYYGENLQNDRKLATKIILSEPNLIIGSPISSDKQFIIESVHINPDVINYMSDALKKDEELIVELCNMNDKNIIQNIVDSCEIKDTILDNPQLQNDKEFMENILKIDYTFLEVAGEELRNDYDFLKQQSLHNYEIVDYVVDNIDMFGNEGIKGVRQASKDLTIDDCMTIIDQLAQKEDGEKYEKLKQKIQDRGIDDVHIMRWVTAMASKSDDIDADMVKKVLNYSMLTMEKNKNELSADSNGDIKLDNMLELISPRVLNRLKSKLDVQGVEVDEELNKKLENYSQFYQEYHEKFQDQKRNKKNMVTVKDVNDATEDVRAGELNEVIEETEKEINGESKENTNEKSKESGDSEYER